MEKVQRKAADVRRRSTRGPRSVALPVMMVVAIAGLLGVFVWRAMNHGSERPQIADVAATAAAPVAAPLAAAAMAQAPAAPPPSALPPQAVASATALLSSRPGMSPTLAHELAERERARRQDDDARRHSEDAMKVMERNTREVGSY